MLCFHKLILRRRVGAVFATWKNDSSSGGLGSVRVREFEYSRQNRYTGHVLCFGKWQHGVNVYLKLTLERWFVALQWFETGML